MPFEKGNTPKRVSHFLTTVLNENKEINRIKRKEPDDALNSMNNG